MPIFWLMITLVSNIVVMCSIIQSIFIDKSYWINLGPWVWLITLILQTYVFEPIRIMIAYTQAKTAITMHDKQIRGAKYECLYHSSKNSIAFAFLRKHLMLK